MSALSYALLFLPATVMATPSYRAVCADLYQRHVHDGGVDYAALAGDPDRRACRDALAETDAAILPAAERLAYWVNAYNLITMLIVADSPERWSVRQDGRVLFADHQVRIGKARRTLDQVEHEEISRLTRDPHIEFVLSCATRGCAPLPRSLVTVDDLAHHMREGEERFFSRRWNLEVDRALGVVYVSQLLSPDWLGGVFSSAGDPPEGIIARHLNGEDARALAEARLRIFYRHYDWRLNRLRRPYGVP